MVPIVGNGVYVALQRRTASIGNYVATGNLWRGPGLYMLRRCFQMFLSVAEGLRAEQALFPLSAQ
jgi:hypothetical protein